MPNLFFFTGENDYAVRQETLKWKQSFREKHGPENLTVLNGADRTIGTILDAVAAMPFIAEKRLVICEGVPSLPKENLATIVETMHPQTILLFVDPVPDKRFSLVKELLSQAQVKAFPLLKPAELSAWMAAYARSRNASMQPRAIKTLLSIVGDDQWVLAKEIEKLALFAAGEITVDVVEELAVPFGEQAIWRLSELLGNGDGAGALTFIRNRIERGEDPYALWIVLLTTAANIVGIWTCLQDGITDVRGISSASGVHFFAVRNLMNFSRKLSRQHVHHLVAWVCDADMALKSGGYKFTGDMPHELIAVLARGVALCGE